LNNVSSGCGPVTLFSPAAVNAFAFGRIA